MFKVTGSNLYSPETAAYADITRSPDAPKCHTCKKTSSLVIPQVVVVSAEAEEADHFISFFLL